MGDVFEGWRRSAQTLPAPARRMPAHWMSMRVMPQRIQAAEWQLRAGAGLRTVGYTMAAGHSLPGRPLPPLQCAAVRTAQNRPARRPGPPPPTCVMKARTLRRKPPPAAPHRDHESPDVAVDTEPSSPAPPPRPLLPTWIMKARMLRWKMVPL